MLSNWIVVALLIITVAIIALYLTWSWRNKDRQKNDADYVEKSISLFQAEVEPYLAKLSPPHDCSEAAAGLKQLRVRYSRMQKLANRFPESSQEHQQIFKQALQPILDKLSEADTNMECFKSPQFKKAFDRFIQVTQKNARMYHG